MNTFRILLSRSGFLCLLFKRSGPSIRDCHAGPYQWGSIRVADYLENGQKQCREHSREELDERVILDGDQELTDAFINSMDKRGERYLHITLAFKEDEVSPETLHASPRTSNVSP